MLKTLFFGTPAFAVTCLKKLCKQYGRPEAVVTQIAKPTGRGQKIIPSPVEQFASENSIPTFPTENTNTAEILHSLSEFHADLALVVAFGQILKEDMLKLPRLFCLNVHASLLPEYRGAAPIPRAILDGKTKTGISVQRIVKKLDAGDVLLRREIEISPLENSLELSNRLADLGAQCLIDAVRLIESGKYEFTPQVPSLVTFAPKIERQDCPIDWSKTSFQILNQIRGLNPWPVAETLLGGKHLKIHRAIPSSDSRSGSPGDLFTNGKSFICVLCGDLKALSLTEIQLENKKRLDVRQFLAAYRGSFPYSRIGS